MELVQNEDYRLKGYYKDETYNEKGDVSKVTYYKAYDKTTDQFSNVKVEEDILIYRDETLGIPSSVEVTITWYKSDGTIMATKTIEKIINGFKGQQMNQQSRTTLVTKAQGYLLQELGLANTQEFGTDVMQEREAYIAGTKQPLLDVIANSTRTYMTQTIKDTVSAILNVDY
jgi:hypothetical protein